MCVNNRCHLSLPLTVLPIVSSLCAWLCNTHTQTQTHSHPPTHTHPYTCTHTHRPCASPVTTLCSAGHASSPLLFPVSSPWLLSLLLRSFLLPTLLPIHGIPPPKYKWDEFQINVPTLSYITPHSLATRSSRLDPRIMRGNLRIMRGTSGVTFFPTKVLILNRAARHAKGITL